jgi:mono/diheme cytochrome c family protein
MCRKVDPCGRSLCLNNNKLIVNPPFGAIGMKRMIEVGWALAFVCTTASAQKSPSHKFSAKQINAGAAIFARNCSPCHGAHMADPEGAFDLRTFPHDQHSRFINSVTNGKNSMPPWGGLLKPEEIEELWAYVVAGEKANANSPR